MQLLSLADVTAFDEETGKNFLTQGGDVTPLWRCDNAMVSTESSDLNPLEPVQFIVRSKAALRIFNRPTLVGMHRESMIISVLDASASGEGIAPRRLLLKLRARSVGSGHL